MSGELHIGTSGYSFRDWVGTVYPEGLLAKEFLSYYAQMFDCVEINTSFYRIPTPGLFEGMLKKVPDEFTFVVKTPREMTHQRKTFGAAIVPFLRGIEPLRDADRLGGLLAQFPYAFRPSRSAHEHLAKLARTFGEQDLPINVEFRHADWQTEETLECLRDLGLGCVNVDLPRLGHLPQPRNDVTSPVAYYRLHGRNAQMWWSHPTPSHRYDYTYPPKELKEWTNRIAEARPQVDIVFAFTNNCRMGASIIDALRMKQLLGMETTIPPFHASADLFGSGPDDPLRAMQQRVDEGRRLDRPQVDAWLEARGTHD